MQRDIRLTEAAREIGVSPVTLITWEQRYGWPRPERTPGGHRRFTPEELEQLRKVNQLRRSMRVSEAIRALTRDTD